MRNLFKQIGLVLPILLLSAIILVIPQLDIRELIEPTQSGKAFGFIWGMLGYVVVVIFIATINKEARTVRITWIDLLLGAYGLMVVISYWLHPTDNLQMLSFGALILFYLSVRTIRIKYLKFILLAVVISGLTQAMYGNLQLWGYYPSNHGIFRMTGSFFNPGPFAGYLCAVLPIAVSIYFKGLNVRRFDGLIGQMFDRLKTSISQSKTLKLFFERSNQLFSNVQPSNSEASNNQTPKSSNVLKGIALITIIVIALVLPASRSRAAWLGALAGCFFVFLTLQPFQLFKRRSPNPFKPFKRAIIVVGILFFAVALVGMYKFKQGSADGRLLIWKVSAGMVKDKPIFGHGTDKFAADYMNYQAAYFKPNPNLPEAMQADNVTYAYNELLKLTVEYGLVGLLLALAVIWCLFFVKSEKGSRQKAEGRWRGSRQKLKNPIHLAARGGLLAIIVFSMFSYPSEILPIKMLFVLFAAIVATHQKPVNLFQSAAKETTQVSVQKTAFASKAIWVAAFAAVLITAYPATQYLTQQYQAYKTWKDASDIYNVGAYPECLEYFELAYPLLKTNGAFLVQYGKALEMAEKHEASIVILNEAKQHLNNTVLYTCLGNNYKALGMHPEAEQAYLHAWHMAPARFYPLYLLVKLYDETGQTEKAVAMAKKVLRKEVKVESTAVEEIKDEMRKERTQNTE